MKNPIASGRISERIGNPIVTDHSAFDYERIVARSKALVDTRNATRHVRDGREKIFLL